MSYSKWLVKLAVVLICGASLLVLGDISCGDDGFYVVGGGSPWRRNGTSIYYTAGNVGIGTDSPGSPLSVYGNSSFTVFSTNSGNGGRAVEGLSTASSGDGQGVHGESISTDNANACGVYGYARGLGSGVKGSTDSTAAYGIYGTNSAVDGNGIYGISSASSGAGIGVYGTSKSAGVGVYGDASPSGIGVYGNSGYYVGVYGDASEGTGVYASGHNGVIATGSGIGGRGVWAIGTQYGLLCEGDLAVTSGTKNAIVPTSQGNRKLYSQESPELWFEDFGEGQLVAGMAHVELDPLFLETVTINDQNPMKVFVQLNDDCNGVYVRRQTTGFEVKELCSAKSSARFTYRVVAKRKGFETARLEAAPGPLKLADLKTPPTTKVSTALAALQH